MRDAPKPIAPLFHVEVDFFQNKFALLVFLARFVGSGVRPSDHALAAPAEDIANAVESRNEQTVFGGAR